ncbi:D-alanyl-D-alanine carboxypeptidase/D-alanyl-D-alanine endopeptidase [Terrimonas pollutisoli]|uniref:D-alanyl-D-alanine carboxypeptidase/D-alanyl-D-alanine endopeptidase n=1 Tax=Terrimonas pollutisoli TaxID=3034147 RepID=UPI0023EBFBDA|nr:D-alanyl-D-alanine carboxypeptidase/D-alanyl-D-alanine-endopeptidase [Terrimonas sp. H1YJ31]
MKKLIFIAGWLLLVAASVAQSVTQKLQKTFQQFEGDDQLKHAISSLYVIDAKTAKVVFDKNSQIGLAPASTQKIITSVTAFELLGKEYRYKTEFGLLENNGFKNLYIKPSGDPTFGSWRWEAKKEEKVLARIIKSINATDLVNSETVFIDGKGWDSRQIPDGWIWQDIGNYYGAGASILNWRENQYDIILKSGSNIGDAVSVVETKPALYSYSITSQASSAAKGTGDNAYIYLPVKGNEIMVRGTIPLNENRFEISGSMINPENQFIETIRNSLKDKFNLHSHLSSLTVYAPLENKPKIFHTEYSPTLDSIIYWLNKKSINLYGEALIKTIAFEKKGFGSTDSGVAIVKDFWKQKGLDEEELNIYDGSGLSPLNRVTTHAQVEILKYAKNKSWYPYFYDALPEYNGMKVKSGTISDVKGFCGYHKAKDGSEYIFSFLVNNYNGKASALVSKMYKVLDVLK